MSMISEQIMELRKYCTELKEYGGWWNNRLACKINDAANTIEELSAKLAVANMEKSDGGWIPCSERLPEKYCHCLVTRRSDYEDGFDTDVREDAWIELEGIWDWESKHEGLIDNIIAWRPLPEPYREDSENG